MSVEGTPPGIEVFEAEEEEDWYWGLGLLAFGGGLGIGLLFWWDSFVDGTYSRRRGGLEKLLDSVGQVPAVALLLLIGLAGLAIVVRGIRRDLELNQLDREREQEGGA